MPNLANHLICYDLQDDIVLGRAECLQMTDEQMVKSVRLSGTDFMLLILPVEYGLQCQSRCHWGQ